MRTHILLVRHAHYQNPRRILHGRLPGFPLSDVGRLQAAAIARTLSGHPVSAVYASPLERAMETARILAELHGLPVQEDERLLDIRTPLQGTPLASINANPDIFYRPEQIAAGGETLAEISGRMNAFIGDMLGTYPGGTVVAVSHGDPIMSMRSVFMEGSLPKFYPYDETYIPQATAYEFVFDESGFCRYFRPIIPGAEGD